MRSHTLARLLLDKPDKEVEVCLDVSTGEHDSDHRLTSNSIQEVIDDGVIVLSVCDPQANYGNMIINCDKFEE